MSTTVKPIIHPKFTVSVEKVGPEEAARFLADTTNNPRRVIPPVVERYARVILAGDWQLGAGFLAVDQEGSLVQGQHTCHAIMLSGEPIETVVFRGVNHNATKALDTGKTRLYSHVLRGEGEPNSIQLAAALRTLWIWERGDVLNPSTAPAISELEHFREERPGIVESVRAVAGMAVGGLRFMASASAPLHFVAGIVGGEATRDEFFESLRSGAGLPDGDPILALRSWLVREATSPRRAKSVIQLAIGVKAWNAYNEGRSVRQLSYRRIERFPIMRGPFGVWPEGIEEEGYDEEGED